MPSHKMGRPTELKKDIMLRVRIDKQTMEKLEECSKIENISKSDVVRNGICEQYERHKK